MVMSDFRHFRRKRGSLPNCTALCLCSKRSPPACGKVQFAGHEYMMRAGWRADLALTLPSPSLCHAHASLCPCCPAERLSSSRLSPPLRLFSLRRDGGASVLAHWAPSVCVSYVWVLMECKLEQVRYEAGYLGQLTFMF